MVVDLTAIKSEISTNRMIKPNGENWNENEKGVIE